MWRYVFNIQYAYHIKPKYNFVSYYNHLGWGKKMEFEHILFWILQNNLKYDILQCQNSIEIKYSKFHIVNICKFHSNIMSIWDDKLNRFHIDSTNFVCWKSSEITWHVNMNQALCWPHCCFQILCLVRIVVLTWHHTCSAAWCV